MLNDAVVENAVALVQAVHGLAVGNLHSALEHVDELLAFMGRELEIRSFVGTDVNHEGLHVATGFLAGQRVVNHVLASLGGVVGETDAAVLLLFFASAYHGAELVVVVEECAKAHA